jgi:hypothetical protein
LWRRLELRHLDALAPDLSERSRVGVQLGPARDREHEAAMEIS